jgi:hypothetical protein
MPVSKRFLTLLSFPLAQFADRDDLRSLIVYVAQPGAGPTPDLVPIGQWPSEGLALPTVGPDSPLRQPAEERRWLPLRHENVLLGALQVETAALPWPLPLRQRLQAVALCLTQALCLDLERQQLQAELQQQREQLQLLLHQLRNPLAALRTFGQLLLRRLEPGNPNRSLVEGLLGLAVDWQQMFIVLAVSSLAVGNLAAIAQTNLKRMLAYSTIAQMGFLLLGLSAGVVSGNTLSAANAYSSAMFYVVTYVLTTLGTFGLIMFLSREGFESEEVSDLAGLARRRPWLAGVMSVFMFSLAGIPPMVGFFAKLAIIQALVTTNVTLYIVLAVVAVVFSLVGAFYYLRVVKVMYFDEPADTAPIVQGAGIGALLAVNGAAVLLLGPFSGGLLGLCRDAIVKALAS